MCVYAFGLDISVPLKNKQTKTGVHYSQQAFVQIFLRILSFQLIEQSYLFIQNKYEFLITEKA